MPQSLQKILAEAKGGRYSSINTLSDDDMANVWEGVCANIEKQMCNQKGVQIMNFGTFSFSQRKLDVGNNKFVLIQRPVFNISEKFAQTHGLQFTKYNIPGHIPTPPLNYAALSFESPFDRDTVESCVREIIGSVSRAIAGHRNVEIIFSGIGRLQIKENRVKMRFYKEFIAQMDGSGEILDAMQNRAGTSDSVMSNRPFSRPNTVNTLVLPRPSLSERIPHGAGANTNTNALPPLAEVDENQNFGTPPNPVIDPVGNPELQQPVEGGLFQTQLEPQLGMVAVQSEDLEDNAVGDFGTEACLDRMLNEGTVDDKPVDVYMPKTTDEMTVDRKGQHNSRAPSRQAFSLAKASGVSLLDDLQVFNSLGQKLSPVPPPEPRSITFADGTFGSGRVLKPPTPPRLEPLQRCRSADNIHGAEYGAGREVAMTPPGSACGHPNTAGQELCYLCHQRARRNVPVYFNEEKKLREEEEDRLLQQYQAMRDAEDTLKEQERHISRRCDLQRISAFNLGVADAVNVQKKAKDTQPQRSFIFTRRPLTPSKFPKQEEYLKELKNQVESRETAESKKKADEQFLERLEQVQLAEDLAAQREKFIRDKIEDTDMYKSALDAQLKFKPLQVPAKEPDNEVFGKNDTNNEKIAEQRRRAYLLFQEQRKAVDERKRDAIIKRLAEQERDQQVLQKTKEGIVEDRAFRHMVRFEGRRRLEDDWMKSAELKRARDLEDRLIGLESGGLLHEQCDKYRRCKQCKRRTDNCGESNIWRESRYIPGSRIMV